MRNLNLMFTRVGFRGLVHLLEGCFCATMLIALGGCPPGTSSGNGNDNVNTNMNSGGTTITGDIVSVRTDRQISTLDSFLSVLYVADGVPQGANIESFFVPVIGVPPNLTEAGDRVITGSNLPAGTNQAFRFEPSVAGPGNYQVGLQITTPDGNVTNIVSAGRIEVLGPPSPLFIQPTEAVTLVQRGEDVFVSFDAGDPEEDAQWRLFLLAANDSRSAPADQLGTELSVGSGNIGSFILSTGELEPGDYQVGLSATDSGDSVARTVAQGNGGLIITKTDGPIVRVEEVQVITLPTLQVTAPGALDVTLFRNEAFTILFNATLGDPPTPAFVELFRDNDTNINNGFIEVLPGAEKLPLTTTSFPLRTDLPEGTFFVGATLRQNGFAPLTDYGEGTVTVVRQATLQVTAPNTILPIAPSPGGEEGKSVTVTWSTNAPPSVGTVEVFAKRLDLSGQETGQEILVLSPTTTSTTSAEFSSNSSGLFRVFVRLAFGDPLVSDIVVSAPQPVRVTSIPRVLWLGSLTVPNAPFEGAIFEGVNFEDNAGTSFTRVGDLNEDGIGEFVVGGRYAKPFFLNPTGIGNGEAYLIFGRSGVSKLQGQFNLNSVGTALLPGVTFAGIRIPQVSNATDGMSSVSRLPDVDNDGKDELVFGFPDTASRGHNVDPQQNGAINPRALHTLERENQFLRGGIVIVSSQNSIFTDPGQTNRTMDLDMVGQDFLSNCVQAEPTSTINDLNDPDLGMFVTDIHSDFDAMDGSGCTGNCLDPSNGGKSDGNDFINFGFVSALSRDYFSTFVYSFEFFGGIEVCSSTDEFVNNLCLTDKVPPVPHEYCRPFTASCEPFSPGLHANAVDPDGALDPFLGFPTITRHSGFYADFLENATDMQNPIPNTAMEPFGARIIGVGLGDKFGTSVTLSNQTGVGAGDIIVASPNRTARGLLLGPAGGPELGGEIDGLGTNVNPDSGVAYLFDLRSLWTPDSQGRVPPKPHQYIVGEASHCSGPVASLIPNVDATRIAGFSGDRITNIVGIDDFNNDGRNDLAVGAPLANGGQGRMYIAFRRATGVEGDFVLDKLEKDPNDPERLAGVLIVTDSQDALGSSLATGVDFNGDGLSDLVVGNPNAANGVGEVLIVFGDPNLVSPMGGISVDTLLTSRNLQGLPRAVRITGNALDSDGTFGFNVANAGDVDGDGLDDLLIAAPNATPRFDPDPTDATDALTQPGIDADFDGVGDPTPDDLSSAGLVYVISSRNALDTIRTCSGSGVACTAQEDCGTDELCTTPNDFTINIDQLGSSQLQGFMIAGRRAGDRIGGGDAGDTSAGGLSAKTGRGRSNGLASAGDVDGDGRSDVLIGSVLADPRRDPGTDVGVQNAGEAYLIYGTAAP